MVDLLILSIIWFFFYQRSTLLGLNFFRFIKYNLVYLSNTTRIDRLRDLLAYLLLYNQKL
jgi:hypothetical protein